MAAKSHQNSILSGDSPREAEVVKMEKNRDPVDCAYIVNSD